MSEFSKLVALQEAKASEILDLQEQVTEMRAAGDAMARVFAACVGQCWGTGANVAKANHVIAQWEDAR